MVLERGTIAFLSGRRLMITLQPDGSDRFRLLMIPKRRLPDWDRRRIFALAFVELEPDARPLAAGRYVFEEHGGHLHLDYQLDIAKDNEADLAYAHLQTRGRLLLLGKSPRPSRRLRQEDRNQPELPLDLPPADRGRVWAPLDSPLRLDQPGAQFVLVDTHVARPRSGRALQTPRPRYHPGPR